ncbi:hypothetical protein AB1N83_012158 [Pleurotus pulmonarius]
MIIISSSLWCLASAWLRAICVASALHAEAAAQFSAYTCIASPSASQCKTKAPASQYIDCLKGMIRARLNRFTSTIYGEIPNEVNSLSSATECTRTDQASQRQLRIDIGKANLRVGSALRARFHAGTRAVRRISLSVQKSDPYQTC